MNQSAFKTLVSTQWLSNKIANSRKSFRLVDASWHLSTSQRNGRKEYLEQHIPTSQYFDVTECSDKTSKYPLMLPSQEQFAEYIGHLGIDNNTHVVIYDASDHPIFSGPRLWWMLRVFGHKSVSLLEGGLNKWVTEGYPTTTEIERVEKVTFNAVLRPELVKSFEDIQKNVTDKQATVIDARSAERFYGTGSGIKSGHIPRSINLPYKSLLDLDSNKVKTNEQISTAFQQAGIDFTKPVVTTCGSGISACILALGAHLLGHDSVPVYDGSWNEWSQRAKDEEKITGEE